MQWNFIMLFVYCGIKRSRYSLSLLCWKQWVLVLSSFQPWYAELSVSSEPTYGLANFFQFYVSMGNCNYNFLFLLFVMLSIMFNPHICRYMFGFCFIWNFQFFIKIHIIIYKILFQNNFIIYYIILVFVCYCFVCVALFRFAQIK